MAQMLKAAGNELFFYSNYDKEDAENRMAGLTPDISFCTNAIFLKEY